MMDRAAKIWGSSLQEIREALQTGAVSSRELAELAIDRFETSEGRLGAFVHFDAESARALADVSDQNLRSGKARGHLEGLPVSLKDLYGVAGWPTFAGTERELPDRWRAQGPVVADLKNQGAVPVGKTKMVEFAVGILGTNFKMGTPRNPWDAAEHRVPGGSSSGAGVSLNQGTALVAFGSDTAGSVRAPASMTGVVGYKPTFGRWSTEGMVPLSTLSDCPGPLTRTVADLIALLNGLSAETTGNASNIAAPADKTALKDLRIGVCDDFFWDDCSPGIAEGVRQALRELENAGARLIDVAIEDAAEMFQFQKEGSVVGREFARFIVTELPEWEDSIDPLVRSRFAKAWEMSDAEFALRVARFETYASNAARHFENVDVLALPTVAVTPPTLGELEAPENHRASTERALRNTCMANLMGLCAITLPAALDRAGLPAGLQFMAANGDDERLVSSAALAELTLGTAADRLGTPPLGYGAVR